MKGKTFIPKRKEVEESSCLGSMFGLMVFDCLFLQGVALGPVLM